MPVSEEGVTVDVMLRFFAPINAPIDKTALLVAVQRMLVDSGLDAVVQASNARAVNARIMPDDFS